MGEHGCNYEKCTPANALSSEAHFILGFWFALTLNALDAEQTCGSTFVLQIAV